LAGIEGSRLVTQVGGSSIFGIWICNVLMRYGAFGPPYESFVEGAYDDAVPKTLTLRLFHLKWL
jgi:hypothetical protein